MAPGRLGPALRVERATVNLLPNPTAGVNTSGWTAGGANTLTRTTTPPAAGALPAGVATVMQIT